MARKILLADDSVTAQNMGRKILADAGYEVTTVNNGSAALKKIAELRPDLVILDVYMPGYSGLEVCQRLKESQDSSRVPVLLTVGKLEPFKPEEAQRVRAEGFIVKPFEASELLSALSKLEDKVVPRAEPSKPGRFARAIAAQEESCRGGEAATPDRGWKSRIGFPPKKAEGEEKAADEAVIYESVNRDLRAVVEAAGEKREEEKQDQEDWNARPPALASREASVDVAAVAPAGLPSDVTPEELAALAAAAAQIHAATDQSEPHQRSVDASMEPAEVAQPEPSGQPNPVEDSAAVPVADAHASADGEPAIKTEDTFAEGPAAANASGNRDEKPEGQDLPLTMAGALMNAGVVHHGGSRWTAVSVALEGEEATLSLDQEMQRAYAAFVAEEASSAGTHPISAGNGEGGAAPVGEISTPAPEAQPDMRAAVAVPEPEPSVPTEVISAATAVPVDSRSPMEAEVAAVGAPPAEFAQPGQEAAVQEYTQPEPEAIVPPAEQAEASGPAVQELPPASTGEAPLVEATASSPSLGQTTSGNPGSETAPEDSETVKSTAAAWASWRQIRDTGDPRPAEPSRQDFNAPAPDPDESAAMAVAVGAGQSLPDFPAPASENPSDVASIVDSVLADLRPRLMAEITRKMSEKK